MLRWTNFLEAVAFLDYFANFITRWANFLALFLVVINPDEILLRSAHFLRSAFLVALLLRDCLCKAFPLMILILLANTLLESDGMAYLLGVTNVLADALLLGFLPRPKGAMAFGFARGLNRSTNAFLPA